MKRGRSLEEEEVVAGEPERDIFAQRAQELLSSISHTLTSGGRDVTVKVQSTNYFLHLGPQFRGPLIITGTLDGIRPLMVQNYNFGMFYAAVADYFFVMPSKTAFLDNTGEMFAPFQDVSVPFSTMLIQLDPSKPSFSHIFGNLLLLLVRDGLRDVSVSKVPMPFGGRRKKRSLSRKNHTRRRRVRSSRSKKNMIILK